MDNKCHQQINTKTSTRTKAYFIAKYIFCGVLFGEYWSIGYTVVRKSKVGLVLGLVMLLMFIFYKDIMIPVRSNKNEFGKYTNIISEIIVIVVALLFGLYIESFLR